MVSFFYLLRKPCGLCACRQGVVRDRRANWKQSLEVLRTAKEMGAKVTKSSIMLGCGETQDEVRRRLCLCAHVRVRERERARARTGP